ncbi:MAG: hypothetical protein R6T93_13985 [Trueperaceae bacterium]
MTVPLRRRPPRLLALLVVLAGLAAVLVACGAEPAAPMTVQGRVALVNGFDVPLVGVLVHVQGTTTTSDADGRFSVANVRPPYTVILGSGGSQPWVHAYEGLTTATPTLSPHAVMDALTSPTAFRRATIAGSLSNPLVANRRIELCAVGLAGIPAYGCDRIEAGEMTYSIEVAWRDAGPVTVRLYALQYQVDADDRPTAVLTNGWVDLPVQDGTTLTQSVPSGTAPVSQALEGTLLASGGVAGGAFVRVRTEDAYVLPVYSGNVQAGLLDFEAPLYPDPEIMVSAYALFPVTGGMAFAWSAVDPTRPFTVSVPVPGQPIEPVDGAAGVDASTPFRAVGGPAGARNFSWSPQLGQNGPDVVLTTMQNEARLPDVSLVGQAWPAGGHYDWVVAAVAAPDLATAAAFPALGVEFFFATGIGLEGTGAVAVSARRAFDLAP